MSTEDEICVIGLAQKAEQQNQKVDYSEVTRTRSGRRIRPPADVLLAKMSSLTKTPTRRTKKSVILEHVERAEQNQASTECHTIVPEPTTIVSIESMQTEPCLDKPNINGSSCSAIPAETVPPCLEKKENVVNLVSDAKQSHVAPLGKPKSGRVWKNRNKQRFSAMVRDKPLRSSWETKMAAKQEKELLKKYSSGLRAEKARKKEEKRKRHEENLKRRAENERKAEIVQVIRSTTKIKRMKKKQLRKIEKRDTLELLQKAHPQKFTGQKRS